MPLGVKPKCYCWAHAGSDFDSKLPTLKTPVGKVPKAIDSVLGNIGLGTKAFEPPFTRDKYLEYFRSIAYGDASLRKHGGNRRVDIQMAAELSNLYAQHTSAQGSIRAIVEDDVRSPFTLTRHVLEHNLTVAQGLSCCLRQVHVR